MTSPDFASPAQPALSEKDLERLASLIAAQTRTTALEAVTEIVRRDDQEGLTVARAWINQDPKQREKYGEEKASWYTYWYDPEGHLRCKSCGPGADGKKLANKLRKRVEAELTCGTYRSGKTVEWQQFRQEYEAKVLSALAPDTQRQARMSLNNFERIIHPRRVSAVATRTIATFTAARRSEPRQVQPRGATKTVLVSPATVNADLRNIKAALTVAQEWGYLEQVPRFKFERLPRKLPKYVRPEHFAALYRACDAARLPRGLQGCTTGDWWRGLLALAYVSLGWRIGQLLGLERSDVDLEEGTVIARIVSGNKAKAEEIIVLHPTAVAHLRKLTGFGNQVFPWPHCMTALRNEMHRLCRLAGIPEYGFHQLRKGFGTMNAARLPLTALQHLMQHKSSQTTQTYYVNPLEGQADAVRQLHVPEVLRLDYQPEKGEAG